MATGGRLRVKLKSYDHRVIDEAVLKIIDTAMATGAKIKGPIPLPTKRTLIPVIPATSRGIKNAQEHFEVLVHKRLVDITEEHSIPSSTVYKSLDGIYKNLQTIIPLVEKYGEGILAYRGFRTRGSFRSRKKIS